MNQECIGSQIQKGNVNCHIWIEKSNDSEGLFVCNHLSRYFRFVSHMAIEIIWGPHRSVDKDTCVRGHACQPTDADMNFSKNSGHGHDANKPRTRVSTDLWGSLNSDNINLSIEWRTDETRRFICHNKNCWHPPRQSQWKSRTSIKTSRSWIFRYKLTLINIECLTVAP